MTSTTINAGVQLSFDAAARALEAHLAGLAARGGQMPRTLWEDIGEYMLGQVQDAFDGQMLFDGRPMPQSAAAIERSGKTLIAKHHLYDSYVYQVTSAGVEVGSNSVYARIHHFGGEAGRNHAVHIEARPVLGLTPEGERHIGSMILAEVMKLSMGDHQ